MVSHVFHTAIFHLHLIPVPEALILLLHIVHVGNGVIPLQLFPGVLSQKFTPS